MGAHLERLVRNFCGTLCAIGIFNLLQTKVVASSIEVQPCVETLISHCRAYCFPRTKFTELICSCLNISASTTSHLNKAVPILHQKERLAFSGTDILGQWIQAQPKETQAIGLP